ncbi:hypothetical protein M409DRAFT_30559 [Zasmidium cellare ATCC 36951]|uniref:Enoyl reductase (ER) domain-containing protein n=1 Tax=Zasmidium cellare ATCC 36951 TaxID=1080233 RepID=A0A6A6BW04_ZASCE|nr:uncharacterized protein M409DRAFT_30559 [Zasmidium cellare ATCC 36951]KAF2159024.1 hypothetical protein M409DRAFT_30559 [Zasmidium cellare ATCC 36951]
MYPTQGRQYSVRKPPEEAARNYFSSLVLENVPIPAVGDNDVLVRIHSVSLNFRDIMIGTGTYIWSMRDGVVPCSDGAGEVVRIGKKVVRFSPGDTVAAIFNQTHISGSLKPSDTSNALGAEVDGMLREYAVFNEQGLVSIPDNLSMEEASTLPCAGVTAWNAVNGGGRGIRAGDTVLTQGTGAVSLFAAQFAVAAGAQVISTTSSQRKEMMLKKLGAKWTINYSENPKWGSQAKVVSPGGLGVDYVIEIGGPETIEQSLKAVKMKGIVATIGQRSKQAGAKSDKEVLITDAFKYPCTMRRIMVGSRDQFEEMNKSIAANNIRPVIDERVFAFEEAPMAFKHLWEQHHTGNVVIRVGR